MPADDGAPVDGRARLRIGEATVHVMNPTATWSCGWTAVPGRTKVVADIAARFDQELADGRHDALFHPPEPEEPDDTSGESPAGTPGPGASTPQ